MAAHDPYQVVEQRIANLENLLGIPPSGSPDGVVDTLLTISNRVGSVLSRNDKVSSVLRRANEISKYSSTAYSEPESTIPESVKLQLILSEESSLRAELEQLQTIQNLEKFLDSEPISKCPSLTSKLGKVKEAQANQERDVADFCHDARNVLQLYNDLVASITETLMELDAQVGALEEMGKPAKQL